MKSLHVDHLPPHRLLRLLHDQLPVILSSDSFYRKFARRLYKGSRTDLSVLAAKAALDGAESWKESVFDCISRMTASVALTGCMARSLQPVEDIGMETVLKACKRLLWDCPDMLDVIASNQHRMLFTRLPIMRTNPLDN
jgi:hypothetical protein